MLTKLKSLPNHNIKTVKRHMLFHCFFSDMLLRNVIFFALQKVIYFAMRNVIFVCFANECNCKTILVLQL